jgi:hypothetical protein
MYAECCIFPLYSTNITQEGELVSRTKMSTELKDALTRRVDRRKSGRMNIERSIPNDTETIQDNENEREITRGMGLCLEVFRAFSTLRRLPIDILCRYLDITRLAVDTAVCR